MTTAASSTLRREQVLCRYFANNACRNGASCPFSHDRTAKADRTCRYYLAGACVYGSHCRYDHVRPRNERMVEKKPEEPVLIVANADLSPVVAVENETHFSLNAEEFIPSWLETTEEFHVDDRKRPLCPYFQSGTCRLERNCPFIHGDVCDMCSIPCLHPSNNGQRAQHRRECLAAHEAAMEEAFAVARSEGKTCGICMENIREKDRRFGILEGCRHCFCLDCIRQWRRSQNDAVTKETVRSCPECRTHSDFVIPAAYWVEDSKDKKALIASFRENAKQKLCKYVKNGKINDCPFGNKCFYKHQLSNGTVVTGFSPRALRRQRQSQCPVHISIYPIPEVDSDDDFTYIAQSMLSRAFNWNL